jgi:hypothetical protein
MTLPPLDELVGRVEGRKQNKVVYPINNLFVPVDQKATEIIYDLDPSRFIYEIQIFKSFVDKRFPKRYEDVVKSTLAHSAREIYKENPNSQMVFCYTSLDVKYHVPGIIVPQMINKHLPDITRKMVLYIGDGNTAILRKLLGAQ